MKRAIFDSNIIIDYLNGIKEAHVEISIYDVKIISIITYIEVLVGVSDSEDEAIVRDFLESFEVVEVSKPIADIAIKLRKQYKLKIQDAIILATAEMQGAILITRDVKDFMKTSSIVHIPY